MAIVKDIKQFFMPSLVKIIITIALLLILGITNPPWFPNPSSIFCAWGTPQLSEATSPLNIILFILKHVTTILYVYAITCVIIFIFNFSKSKVAT